MEKPMKEKHVIQPQGGQQVTHASPSSPSKTKDGSFGHTNRAILEIPAEGLT